MSASDSEPVFGATNPAPEDPSNSGVVRFGSVIGLNRDKEKYYRELHSNVWPSVLDRIKRSNIRNYSIYTSEIDGKKYLFSYFEYVGENLDADMKAIAEEAQNCPDLLLASHTITEVRRLDETPAARNLGLTGC